MKSLCFAFCAITVVKLVNPAPAGGFAFPDERRSKKLEPIITPPVLPVIEHLERDPSTLLPNETGPGFRSAGSAPNRRPSVKPRFGFSNGFSLEPNSNGFTASVSGSSNGGGASQSASQSFSFGLNQGISASHSASQSASFGSGFNGFSGSQSSSQAGSFSGGSFSSAASSAAAFAGNGHSGSQSASSAFGFNGFNGFKQPLEYNFGDDVIDVRHRGAPDFFFPSFNGRSKGVGAAAFRTGKKPFKGFDSDFLSVVVSD